MHLHKESTYKGYKQPGTQHPTAPATRPRRKHDGGKKLANGIVALSSAAIVAVYAAGYLHTASAEASITGAAPTAIVASIATTPTAPAASLLTPTAGAAAPTATTAIAATTTTAAATAAVATATSTPTATAVPTQIAIAVPTQAAIASSTYQDGVYTGSGTSKHGGVTVAVTIKNGAIASVAITASNTRYPISRIAALPGQVVVAQSASIDFVSGATDSSRAFQMAVASALTLAKGA